MAKRNTIYGMTTTVTCVFFGVACWAGAAVATGFSSAGLALPHAEFAKYHKAITGRAPADGLSGKDAYTIVSKTGECK